MWVTAQTPWGVVAFGRRPFAFGFGWSGLHEKDADTDSIIIVAPYGPLTFIVGPSSAYGTPGDGIIPNSTPIVGVNNAAPGFAQGLNALNGAKGTDKNRYRIWHMAAAVTYRNGPVDTGIFFTSTINNNQHNGANPAGPALRDDNNATFAGTIGGAGVNGLPMYGDPNTILFVNYFKYFNGRFFFNAEYDFLYGDVRRTGGRPVSIWADAWELEFGALCGPAKLSLAGFYSSGHDRRNGILNPAAADGGFTAGNTANGSYDRASQFATAGGRYQAIAPYVWLLGIYGGGNNSYDIRGLPTYADFLAYAARLDYAVAANLNVFASYIYMNRASNTGTGVGSFAGGLTLARSTFVTLPGGRTPNVPDDYLGWEANVGVNWKLLEGLSFNSQFAYWQPGDWFKYAYVDYTNTNTVTIGGLAGVPINPNRGIDPLIGFQGSLVVDF
jgi:hypothetical protein